MVALSALLTLSLAATVTLATQYTCENLVNCPCGSTGKNIKVCIETKNRATEVCKRWSRCKSCQDGLNKCLQCEDGFEGPLCSVSKKQKLKSRQKRQSFFLYARYCPNLDSPKLGSIRCTSNGQRKTCVGRCLPGYIFENHESEEELILTCQGGTWTPLDVFPPCISQGHCEILVQGSGSFNCTTGMQGTRCDVNCGNRYAGRYYCYTGRSWDPPLPHCVTAKEISGERQFCNCQYGASCDSGGNCICPVGRRGTFCEIIVPDAVTCPDPGFISNGFRRYPDGTESDTRRSFEEGESVVYGCRSDAFALQGLAFLTCRNDGTWSNPLPKCITSGVLCPDPGQVDNADRLNSDASPSMGVQQYRVGQFVVYTCHPGFALQRRSLITCLPSGQWSYRTPECTRITEPSFIIQTTTNNPGGGLRNCRDPGVDPNGSRRPTVTPNRWGFPQRSGAEFFCNPGYNLVGRSSIYCLSTGRWSANRPVCEPQARSPDTSDGIEPSYCFNPPSISNGQVAYYPKSNNQRRGEVQQNNLIPEGSRLQYSCNSGYSLVGSSTLICESSGIWSADTPFCRRRGRIRYCRNPGLISNGRVTHFPSINSRTQRPSNADDDMDELYPEGSLLQYSCDPGYTLEGPDTLSCQSSGSWSSKTPVCVKIGGPIMFCDNPGRISNGRITIIPSEVGPRSGGQQEIDYPEGTELEYSCEYGYKREGPFSQRCLATGYWSPIQPPRCDLDCGHSFIDTTPKVLYGDNTTAGDWPWVVAISVETNNSTRLICGGALINTRTVLTAAHCLTEGSRYILYFGKYHRDDRYDDALVSVRHSTRVIIHPNFNSTTIDSDIGLIKFEPSIEFSERVQPICLPTGESTAENLMTGNIGYVTGWGKTERHLPAKQLQLARLPVMTREACIESYRNQNVVLPLTSNMFCAGSPQGQQSVCSGDSGSPLVFLDNIKKRFIVEGLVSFGVVLCGQPGRYPIFTTVYQFKPWILTNMQ